MGAVLEKISSSLRPGQLPTTLLGLLERAAAKWPDHGIKVCRSINGDDFEFLSYAQLLSQAKVCDSQQSFKQYSIDHKD